MLTAKGLSAGHADRVVFSGVDLVVSPGKVIGLVGANGAGKSTLLRMLAGLDDGARDAGSVSLNPGKQPSVTCRRSRSGGRARVCSHSSGGGPG